MEEHPKKSKSSLYDYFPVSHKKTLLPRKRKTFRPLQRDTLQPNLGMFGIRGTKQQEFEPQIYSPDFLLDLDDGILFEILKLMKIKDIKALCNSSETLKQRCWQEMAIANLSTDIQINFFAVPTFSNEDPEDIGDPIQFFIKNRQ